MTFRKQKSISINIMIANHDFYYSIPKIYIILLNNFFYPSIRKNVNNCKI